MFPSITEKKDPVNPLQTCFVYSSWDVWPKWWIRRWFGILSPCSYVGQHGIKMQALFNLMGVVTVITVLLKIVSAMELEMSIRKMMIKKFLGRVVTCEKSWILPSLFLFFWTAVFSCQSWAQGWHSHHQHKSCDTTDREVSSPWWERAWRAQPVLQPRASLTTSHQPLETSGDGKCM